MKKLKLLIAIVLFCTIAKAQERVSISVYQDAKFLVAGDPERGYDPGTIDLVARFTMQGKQQDFGYMIVFPEFEYAEIEGTYYKYSLNTGYVLNELFIKRTEIGASIGYGFIDRWGKSFFSFGASGFINYKITDRIKGSLMLQFTERKDLAWAFGKNEIRTSGFVGLEINLN